MVMYHFVNLFGLDMDKIYLLFKLLGVKKKKLNIMVMKWKFDLHKTKAEKR